MTKYWSKQSLKYGMLLLWLISWNIHAADGSLKAQTAWTAAFGGDDLTYAVTIVPQTQGSLHWLTPAVRTGFLQR